MRNQSEIFNDVYPEDTALGVALALTARTATNNSATFKTPYGVRGLRVWIKETAHTSSPYVVFKVQDINPVGGDFHDLITSAAIVAEGTTVLTVYPGLTPAANVTVSDVLSKSWRILATHGNSDSITYSVGFSYLY